ncbi:MAG TPA: endonuclease domain-containing protein [Xanthobacteraceae bacterium]|nr:endonuclease domain-containing protein [Xanthobacteraceae bacterium]
MTRAETLLWRYLKAHHIDGIAFRRQVPMGRFIADFVSHAARVVVEVDGGSHDFRTRRWADLRRDEWFVSQRYAVLRFTNEQVLKNLEGVIETIRETASARQKHLPPSLTLPHKGGGNNFELAAQKPRRRTNRTLPLKKGGADARGAFPLKDKGETASPASGGGEVMRGEPRP